MRSRIARLSQPDPAPAWPRLPLHHRVCLRVSRPALGRGAALVLAGLAALGCSPDMSRRAAVHDAFFAAERLDLQTRPALARGKLVRMASTDYAFFRGAMPLFAADLARGACGLDAVPLGQRVVGLGDPHVENFGSHAEPRADVPATDGPGAAASAFDAPRPGPNDFDAAAHVRAGWDLRRLSTSVVLAARAAGGSAALERAAVTALTTAYLETAAGDRAAPPAAPLTAAPYTALMAKAARKSGTIRDKWTRVTNGARQLLRGTPDPARPWRQLANVPDAAAAETRALWARSMPAAAGAVKDVARFYGRGISSFARLRLLVLTEGATADPADDLIFEVKTMVDRAPDAALWATPLATDRAALVHAVYAHFTPAAAAPALSDWRGGTWWGLPVQIRPLRGGDRGLDVADLTADDVQTGALSALGADLGAMLAAAHTRPFAAGDARLAELGPAFAAAIAALDENARAAVLDAEVRGAVRAANCVAADRAHLIALLRAAPDLGVSALEETAPSDAPAGVAHADWRALFTPAPQGLSLPAPSQPAEEAP